MRTNETVGDPPVAGVEPVGRVSPLYRRLPFGPNGMRREQVARNQRARIYGAMIESVAERGYEQTTVAHLIALAGVSRRSFYELFPGKERCFLATHDSVLARQRTRVIEAWQRERGWASRMQSACNLLLGDLASQRKASQLVLVDSLDVGAKSRERTQLAGLVFERLLASAFRAAPDRAEHSPLLRRAIVGGAREALRKRVLQGGEQHLSALTDELLAWMDCYRWAAPVRLGANGSSRPLPSLQAAGPAALPQGSDDRALAVRALVSLTLQEGYAGLSDARIAQFAGISTERFHRRFADRQACFLAVLDGLGHEALRRARGPFESACSWPQGVGRAICALLRCLLENEALLRLALVNVFEVGAAAASRLTAPVDGLAELLAGSAPDGLRGCAFAREALPGAIWASIGARLGGRGGSSFSRLADELSFIVLAPEIGPGAAVEEIAAARRSSPRLARCRAAQRR